MFHRRGTGSDDFGNPETLNEIEDGKGIRVRTKYAVQFTNSKRQALEAIEN